MTARTVVRPALVWTAVLAAAVFAAMLSPTPASGFCGTRVVLSGPLDVPVSCDSSDFVDHAVDPTLLLDRNDARQARPAHIAVAAAVATIARAPLAVVPVPDGFEDRIDAFRVPGGRRLSDRQLLAGYLAYEILNVAIVMAALLLFHVLVDPSFRVGVAVVSLGSLLAASVPVKAFFWSPHSQMFTILVPIATVALVRAVLRQPDRSVRWYLGAGLAIGGFLLAYGSFLYTVVAVGVAVALRLRAGAVSRIAAVVTGAILPNLVWIATCIVVAGSYYNHEIATFRQFVWVIDAVRQGDLLRQAGANLHLFAVATLPTVALPTVVAGALIALAGPRALWERDRDLVVACGLTLAAGTLFVAGLGLYAPRLSFNLVPPLVIVAAAAGVRVESRHGVLVRGLLGCGAFAWLVYFAVAAGPYD